MKSKPKEVTADRVIGRPYFGPMRCLDREIHDFTDDVIERSRTRPVLVEYWAPWCEQSRMCAEDLRQACEQCADGYDLVTVNMEMHFELLTLLGIRSVPALQFYVDGHLAGALSGLESRSAIGQWLRDMLSLVPHGS